MRLVQRMDRRFYPDCASHWDDERFRAEVLGHVSASSEILDLGAGAGILGQMDFRHDVARVCGVDPDPRITTNPFLHEGKVGVGEAIPYPDECFDAVVADNVLEHLERPVEVFREVARVLRPGGWFLAKTPNRFHYVPLIARTTPHGFHEWVSRRRGRRGADTFPTLYRANSVSAIHRHATAAGLRPESIIRLEARPEYLRFHPIPYLVGIVWERVANSTDLLAFLRVLVIAKLRKP